MWVSFEEEAALKMDLMEQELSQLKLVKAGQNIGGYFAAEQ